MDVKYDTKSDSKVAIISSNQCIISNIQDALDLMVNIQVNDCYKMIINKENIIEDFFELKTRLAGEILQKYTNYDMKLAIIGDFNSFNSKSLNDFIYESNKGKQVFFKENINEALEVLHKL